MMPTAVRTVLHHVQRSVGLQEAHGVTDAQLLERFLATHDQAAFELIVWRHERLVYNVCRRILHDHHAAEDAFQATFLTLARKARGIGKRTALACWLHQVAFRIALRMSRRRPLQATGDFAEITATDDPARAALWQDLAPVLDQAVGRLPETLRQPVLLCYLSGKTYAQAAAELGCAKGTLSSRLTEARSRLQRYLAARDITFSLATLSTLLTSAAVTAAPPVALAARTIPCVLAATSDMPMSNIASFLQKGSNVKAKCILTSSCLAGLLALSLCLWTSQGHAVGTSSILKGQSTTNTGVPTTKQAPGPQDAPIVVGAEAQKAAAYLDRLADRGLGGVLLVAKGDQILVHKGFGLADRDQQVPFVTGTVSTIGSITKQFTATAILKLEMMGKLSTNDPLTKFFDNVPPEKTGITVHQLLTHTSGLIDGLGSDFDLKATKNWVRDNALKSTLLAAPGERFRYSNLGYSLLGMIVEQASGQPYEDFLQEHLFKPAGMMRTGYLAPKYVKEHVAIGYQQEKRWGTVVHRPWLPDGPCWNLRANGCIHSTTEDMLKWIRAIHASDKVLSPEARKKMFTPFANRYGYGWDVHQDRKERKLIEHNGGNGVLFADLKYYPDEQLLIFMMTNQSTFSAEAATPIISRIMHGEPYDLPPQIKPVVLDPAALQAATGDYRLPSGGKFTIRVAGKQWRVTAQGQDAIDVILPEMAQVHRECNTRALQAAQALGAGDFAALRKLRGQEEPEKPFASYWHDLTTRHGKYQSVEVLGTAPAWFANGDPATWVRFHFEKGTVAARFHWDGSGKLAGIGGQQHSAPLTLDAIPTAPTEAVGTHLQLSLPEVRFRIENGSEEQMQLQIITPRGKTTATKVK